MDATEAFAAVSRAMPPVRGKANLGWKLMERARRRGRIVGTLHVRLRDGTRLELPRQSDQSWGVAFTGVYDPGVNRYVSRFIRPNTVALDVGASLGLWTVQLGKVAASRGALVWAFEPNPANTSWIRRNVALNELSETVTVREVGLGDKAESATLVSEEGGVGGGTMAITEREGTTNLPRIPVTIARLDEIDLPAPVSFIKIDVEGFEVAFLRGAAKLIERDRPVIFGEFHPRWLERRGENLRAALGDLEYDLKTVRARRTRRWSAPRVTEVHSIDLASTGAIPGHLPGDLLLFPKSG
jgi:FkbM family methyltransferase